MWHSIKKGPYVRPMIPDLDDTREKIIKPLSRMTETNKKQYIADVRVVNYLLQTIPNDIYNSVDACRTAQEIRERIKRMMYGSDVTNHRVPRTESNSKTANVQCNNCNEKGHYACDCQKPRVRNANYFREQMLLAMKDEARSNLNAEENDFMLDSSFGDEILEELTAAVIMMACIQPGDVNVVTEPKYDAKVVGEEMWEAIESLQQAVPEHTTVESPTNISPENKAYFLAEKEAIHLILTGIGDDIYSIVDAF
nr:hypothetical protein [Tanacetum cinerariifolium]